jgi:hyperosmotically inducible protein
MLSQNVSRPVRKVFALFALAVMLGLGGAAVAQAQEGPATRSSARQQESLAREVHHQLAMLTHYTVFDNIGYQINGNNVTLTGEVAVPVNKDDAQAALKGIEGIGQINNQIQVLPPSPMDDQIRRAEYRAIFSFDNLSKYSFMNIPAIHIIVSGGRVTLYGVVDNQADKDAAGIRANGVPDVFSVTNNIQVATKGKS